MRMSNDVAGNQVAEAVLTPILRFPEFRDAGGWVLKKLETIGQFTGGGTPSKENASYWAGDIPWVSSSDISEGSIFAINISRFITEEAIRESATKIVPANSILLISRVGVGKLAVTTTPVCTSQDFTNFTPAKADLLFLAYLLKSRKKTLLSFNQGTSIKGFTKANVASLELGLPSSAEQQKIAQCLTTLDEVIAAQSQKIDALKAHKKGLMQQLFPREGETLPRLRFPEFQATAEWRETNLESLAHRASGHTPSKAHPEYYNGGIQWVSLADSRRLDNGLISETEIEISEQGIKNSSAVLHPAGTVLISRDAGIGKSAVMNSPMAVSQHFIVWRCDSSQLSNWFLYYLLQKLKPLFERVAIGSTIKTIGLPFFKELRVTIPVLREQQKIVGCLTSLDDFITTQSAKLEALKTHKQGLMQQLFPSPEAVEA